MERILELIDLFFMVQTVKIQGAIKAFKEEERGASDMVAAIVLIVIIIALAVIFKQQLSEIVTAVFGKLSEFVNQ